MIESLLEWLTVHSDQAPYIIFGLLVLTGLSVPISEDAMLIASGVLASTVIPEQTAHLFLGVLLGCYVSDCIAYAIGRFFGDKLSKSRWGIFALSESRVQRLNMFYHRYGFLTMLVGRFIPFGVRNGIFMTAGAGKMPFARFACIDAISCLLFSGFVFFTSYFCAEHFESRGYDALHNLMYYGGIVLLGIVACSVFVLVVRKYWLKRVAKRT